MIARKVVCRVTKREARAWAKARRAELDMAAVGRGMAQAQELVSQLAGMFAGGDLSDQDREAVMRSLERAYWLAKEDNQKYTPKKYRK